MAIKGLALPRVGKYTNTNGTVTYSEGKVLGHAIEYSVEVETTDDNPLYGDNMIVEHDNGSFGSGTLTLTTSELTGENAMWLLGLTSATEGTGDNAITVYSYDDNSKPITVGFGIVETHQINDVDQFKAVILPKCVPRFPSDSATTKGETIEWQTPEIEFGIERSDEAGHPWKKEAWFSTETAAEEWLETKLAVTSG